MVRERTRSGTLARERTGTAPVVDPADLTLAAQSHATVLVTAPSGAERARYARAIHRRGLRCRGPFVAVSCRTPGRHGGPGGHGRGAPDDAGLLQASYERADGGTLFIDEVAAMSPPAQARLFGLLGGLGGPRAEADAGSGTSGVRVIAGASPALEAALAAGRFSRPLFYRLNVIHLRSGHLADRRVLGAAARRRQLAAPARRVAGPFRAAGPGTPQGGSPRTKAR